MLVIVALLFLKTNAEDKVWGENVADTRKYVIKTECRALNSKKTTK
jgi:hypothetical protein